MTDLITLPPDLVDLVGSRAEAEIAEKILQWAAPILRQQGADQELEACCEWLEKNCGRWEIPASLRAARRPKSPSLKEQAFAALKDSPVDPVDETLQLSADAELIIRRALEALDA